jgi:hypothetical protein
MAVIWSSVQVLVSMEKEGDEVAERVWGERGEERARSGRRVIKAASVKETIFVDCDE